MAKSAWKKKKPPEEYFFKKVTKTTENKCWIWNAGKIKGYGLFMWRGRKILAHRFSYIFHKGEIPKNNSYHGTCVLHSCDTPCCVNPKHLFLGTQTDNMKDMTQKKRRHTCYGEENGKSRLKKTQVIEIRKLSKQKTQKELSIIFNCHPSTIQWIVSRKMWRHV